MLIFRPTRKHAKRLIYFALLRDSKFSKGKDVGVDFGCKGMKNRRLFKTRRYYGVDLDRDALDEGLARYPEAQAIHARIENAEVPPADFALCVNVFGATNFANSDAHGVVRKIIASVKPGGTLLMTFQNTKRRYDINAHFEMLRKSFDDVDIMALPVNSKRSSFSYLEAKYYLYRRPQIENPIRFYCKCLNRLQTA